MVKVKASALYMVVIISLLIAIITGSLLTIAFYYRLELKKKERLDRLMDNLSSGTAMLLSKGYTNYEEAQVLDLYDEQRDSLSLRKEYWGAFELGAVQAFELNDTLKRVFLIGASFPDLNAIYLADEDRPLSISGKTQIIGNGQLPKSGLRPAYVEGNPYEGKALISGVISHSAKDLPAVDQKMLERIFGQFSAVEQPGFSGEDSISNSFFNPAVVYRLNVDQSNLTGLKIKGKVILVSDTTVSVDGTTYLENVQIYAPAIKILDGFKGNCQLFARDSIIIGKDCEFVYPSFAGVFKPEESKIQAKIRLGMNAKFSGLLFSHEKGYSDLQTIISLGKGAQVTGEVFATGYISMEKETQVFGKVYARRFMMQTASTLYENYLIDITLNRKLLSKHYLSSPLLTGNVKDQNLLKWLN